MAKTIANPVTEEHVEAFTQYVRKWQQLLNLMDWRIEPSNKRSKAMAEIGFDDDARLASYRVGEHFGTEPVTPASLEATALHELLHLRVRELVVAAMRGLDTREALEHGVINTLEKLLMAAYAERPGE